MKGGALQIMADESLSKKRAEAGRKGGKARAKKQAQAKSDLASKN